MSQHFEHQSLDDHRRDAVFYSRLAIYAQHQRRHWATSKNSMALKYSREIRRVLEPLFFQFNHERTMRNSAVFVGMYYFWSAYDHAPGLRDQTITVDDLETLTS